MDKIEFAVEVSLSIRHRDLKIIGELFKRAHDSQLLDQEILNNLQTDLVLIFLPDPYAYEQEQEENIKKFLHKLFKALFTS